MGAAEVIPMAILVPMRALLDEPLDVRERFAKKLRALADGIGDQDRSMHHTLRAVANLLERGTTIPLGASVD